MTTLTNGVSCDTIRGSAARARRPCRQRRRPVERRPRRTRQPALVHQRAELIGEGRGGRLEERPARSSGAHQLAGSARRAGEERHAVLDALVDDVGRVVDQRRHHRQPTRLPEIGASASGWSRSVGTRDAVERRRERSASIHERTSSGVKCAGRPRNVTFKPVSRSGPSRFNASTKTRTPLRSSRRPKNTSSVSGLSGRSGCERRSRSTTCAGGEVRDDVTAAPAGSTLVDQPVEEVAARADDRIGQLGADRSMWASIA